MGNKTLKRNEEIVGKPLICRRGCLYADGERTIIVPITRMAKRHQLDSQYRAVAESMGVIISSRIKGICGRLSPCYVVEFKNGNRLPFLESELNYGNFRIFNQRKVFNYTPHIKYAVGERVKIRTPDLVFRKVESDQFQLLGKEVRIWNVILNSNSFPDYVVWFDIGGKYEEFTIGEDLIQYSIDGRWQKEESWMYDIEDKSFPEFVISNNLDDLPF